MVKGSSRWLIQVKRVLCSLHFWLIFALLIGCGILHYVEQIGIAGTTYPSFHFGLARHAFDRILFLVPIVYSGFVFGLAGGVAASLVALFLMLPRALLVSPSSLDALLEIAGVILVGTLVCLWFRSQARRVRAEEQRKLALDMMDNAQQKLRSQVRLTMEHQERLITLSAISGLLAEPLETERTLRIAIDVTMKVMKVDAVLVFLLDQQADELVLTAHEGVSPQVARNLSRISFGEVFTRRVAGTGEVVVVEDDYAPRLFKKAARQEKLQSQLTVPVKSRGQVVGALWVARHRRQDFFPGDADLLVAIANQIGAALENARLYEAACKTAERLYKSEREYRSLFENAHDAIWFHNFDGIILAANKAAEQLTGYEVESLIGMNVAEFLSQEELKLAKEVRQKLLVGEVFTQPYEQRLVRKDGSQATFMLTSSLITFDGEPVGFQHIARDVTEEKRMEENLRFYLQHITNAQEEERKRISRELHDSTAQTLIAMLYQLENFLQTKTSLRMGDTRTLWKLHEEIRTVLQEVRQFGRDLRPSILDDLGLIPSLEWLCSEMRKENGTDTKVQVIGSERRFPPEVELMLFRIIQEALRNVARHSAASEAQVTVIFNEQMTKVTIEDNGKGFALPETITDLSRLGKLGLAGMQERARLLGGSLKVESECGKGTRVITEVPF
ncbi:MAG: PAS domain S-box protein [Dehalococcoidia bacterium]|nr:MAG: PAS domain S-box protein [Dehalococcoidia bacterium]